jgi:predicted RNA binding protein YcfA (HicA-like mRNA interferase family)
MKVRDIIREVERAGWVYQSSEGSHHHFKHPKLPGKVTVPGHDRDDLRPRTLNSIRRAAGLMK